ncbi:hypothetical protein [Paenibacillus sp. MBLB4367]|uniref:hypothetical protein n=1 Tax=Paenibacillus sp. MBLB4367 TaxID=3384767 RepID=UPI003907FD7B
MTRLRTPSTKLFTVLLLAFSLFFTQAAVFAAEPQTFAAREDGAAQVKQFLQEKFGVGLSGTITKADFIQAIARILGYKPSGKEVVFSDLPANHPSYASAAALYENGILDGPAVQGEETLTKSVAVSIAVRAAGIKELAYTYPAEKIDKALGSLQVTGASYANKVAQELASAVDTGLLPDSFFAGFRSGITADEQLVNALLGKVLVTKGLYKKYIGYVNDPDIYAKLNGAYDSSDIIDVPKLQKLVNTALEQNLITGYSLKDTRFEPNFIPSLSLIYGHSDLTHAIQLIGLLRSEGLNAKVQFEPKTSAFIHLAEWGDPGPNVVKIANGNYIAYAKEYDLAFEFSTAEDKAAFQQVVLTYAKKNVKDQTGLIAGSWWQPLYYSSTELKDYERITNNFITDKDSPYTANPFSLNEDSAKVVEGLKAIDKDAVVTPIQFWVDKPFFNYLHGEAL